MIRLSPGATRSSLPVSDLCFYWDIRGRDRLIVAGDLDRDRVRVQPPGSAPGLKIQLKGGSFRPLTASAPVPRKSGPTMLPAWAHSSSDPRTWAKSRIPQRCPSWRNTFPSSMTSRREWEEGWVPFFFPPLFFIWLGLNGSEISPHCPSLLQALKNVPKYAGIKSSVNTSGVSWVYLLCRCGPTLAPCQISLFFSSAHTITTWLEGSSINCQHIYWLLLCLRCLGCKCHVLAS